MDFQSIWVWLALLVLLLPIVAISSIIQMVLVQIQREAWKQLAREIGADFIKGRFWSWSDKVVAKMKHWTITLYTDVRYSGGGPHGGGGSISTCLRAPYVGKDGFQFSISHKGFFSSVGRLLGTQDIELGYPDFDQEYIIKGNDERKVRELFANPKIRNLIQLQPRIDLSIDRGLPLCDLYFGGERQIKDLVRLKSLFELIEETLNQLCRIGSATEDDPNLVLSK